jgi:hypothetical protein
MKLFIDGEKFKDKHGCWPTSFFFGEVKGCKRLIYETVNRDGFENINEKTIFNTFCTITILAVDYFKTIFTLFNIEIVSLGLRLVEINNFILLFIYNFIQEKILLYI